MFYLGEHQILLETGDYTQELFVSSNNGSKFNLSAGEEKASHGWAIAWSHSRYCWIQGRENLGIRLSTKLYG
jgi:hypothetical protein